MENEANFMPKIRPLTYSTENSIHRAATVPHKHDRVCACCSKLTYPNARLSSRLPICRLRSIIHFHTYAKKKSYRFFFFLLFVVSLLLYFKLYYYICSMPGITLSSSLAWAFLILSFISQKLTNRKMEKFNTIQITCAICKYNMNQFYRIAINLGSNCCRSLWVLLIRFKQCFSRSSLGRNLDHATMQTKEKIAINSYAGLIIIFHPANRFCHERAYAIYPETCTPFIQFGHGKQSIFDLNIESNIKSCPCSCVSTLHSLYPCH